MDQIEEVSPEFVQYKNEQCIQIRFRDGIRDGRAVLTNTVSIFDRSLLLFLYFFILLLLRCYFHIVAVLLLFS